MPDVSADEQKGLEQHLCPCLGIIHVSLFLLACSHAVTQPRSLSLRTNSLQALRLTVVFPWPCPL